jgi:hypothetical protein
VEGLVRSKEGDVDNYRQADYITLEELYLKPLYIKRLDLVLKGCLRHYICRRNAYNTIPAIKSYFYKGQVV